MWASLVHKLLIITQWNRLHIITVFTTNVVSLRNLWQNLVDRSTWYYTLVVLHTTGLHTAVCLCVYFSNRSTRRAQTKAADFSKFVQLLRSLGAKIPISVSWSGLPPKSNQLLLVIHEFHASKKSQKFVHNFLRSCGGNIRGVSIARRTLSRAHVRQGQSNLQHCDHVNDQLLSSIM